MNALQATFVHRPADESVDWRLSATISPCHVTVICHIVFLCFVIYIDCVCHIPYTSISFILIKFLFVIITFIGSHGKL